MEYTVLDLTYPAWRGISSVDLPIRYMTAGVQGRCVVSDAIDQAKVNIARIMELALNERRHSLVTSCTCMRIS